MAEPPSFDGVTCPIVANDQRKGGKKRTAPDKSFRKAPGAPKRFRSPYILFSIHRMDKLRQQMGSNTNVTSISKHVSDEWKALSESDRHKWFEQARFDKERYNAERSLYTGPWVIPSKRSRKDPSAPKRPMSAFLFYSQHKRKELKDLHPGLKNTDVSRLLGEHWNAAAEEERMPFIERERRERLVYNKDIAEWRQRKDDEEKAAREHRQLVTEEWIKSGYHTNGTGAGAQVMTLNGHCIHQLQQRQPMPYLLTHHSAANHLISVPHPFPTFFHPVVHTPSLQGQMMQGPTTMTAIVPPRNDPQAAGTASTNALTAGQPSIPEYPNMMRADQIGMAHHALTSLGGTFSYA